MTTSSVQRPGAGPDPRYERLLEVQSLLARVSRDVGPALHLDEVLARMFAAMRSLVDFDGGHVALVEEGTLTVAASDPPLGLEGPMRLPAAHGGAAGRVAVSGESERSGNLAEDPRAEAGERQTGLANGIVSYLCVPLISMAEVIGAVLVHSSETDAFDDEDRVLLEGLATQVAGAIESARRYEMITELEVLKSDFIARVSHELRTPITIMSGFVGTLLTNHDRIDDGTRRRMLERVDLATNRLSGLIDELLMLSRLEAGVVAAQVQTVELGVVLENVRRQSTDPDAITVSCGDVHIETDPALLVRALGFLVDNALKYAGTCDLRGSETTIEVVDRGPGIPEDERSRVFERFTRANEDTTVPGMGIGLPMARTLLAAAGADLAIAEPEDGIGTRVLVQFW